MMEYSNHHDTSVVRTNLLNTIDYPGVSFAEGPRIERSNHFDLFPNVAPSIDVIPSPVFIICRPNRNSFAVAYQNFKREINLTDLALDPDELFAGARDATRGRNIRL